MCIFHKWSKWEEYLYEFTYTPIGKHWTGDVRGKVFESSERRQKRTCKKCGRIQDIKIRADREQL